MHFIEVAHRVQLVIPGALAVTTKLRSQLAQVPNVPALPEVLALAPALFSPPDSLHVETSEETVVEWLHSLGTISEKAGGCLSAWCLRVQQL